MKIAIVWNYESRVMDCSFRFEQYLSGFRALGHQPTVVCTRASAEGFDGPVEIAQSAAVFEDAGFWESVGAEVALIVTWLGMVEVLAAIRRAGTQVIAIADTDGLIGLRLHPLIALERMIVYQNGWVERAKCVKYWLGRYLTEGFKGSAEDRERMASGRQSDLLVLCSPQAQSHFERFLEHCGEPQLCRRLFAAPFIIGEVFLSSPVPESKAPRIAAIGRWQDPQKNPALLVDALSRVLDQRPETEVVLFGAGGERWFDPFAEQYPTVSYLGPRYLQEVAETLSTCRAVFIPSRWESGPHIATEGLAVGATIVGPAIPGLVSWSEDGRFGHIATSSRPRALARALCRELDDWDEGRRDPQAIAETWRERLAPERVCGQLLEALEAVSA
ncbi:MAG: glycosyltransferase [bacterium]|nr:glycosyltransferase [bacterium]